MLLSKESLKVSARVYDVHDANAGLTNAVEDQVLTNREAAVTRPQLVPPPPEVRIIAQQLKMLDQQIDESIRRGLVILGDIGPDQQDIAASPGSQAVAHQDYSRRRSARASDFRSLASRGELSCV